MGCYKTNEEISLESEKSIYDSDSGSAQGLVPFRLRRYDSVHRIINYVLTATLLCSIVGVWLYGAAEKQSCDLDIESYYYYSPALGETNPGSRVTQFNHTKWSPFSPSSLTPLEYVDSNWTAILRVGMMGLSEEELRRAGGSPDSMRLPPESGGGYMVYLASHHYLHCLYILHQSLHPDYYQTRSVVWNQSAERRVSHWDHCVETLRQYVTCNADTTVLTHSWFEDLESPISVAENPRRCADWDAHFRWQLDRQVPAPYQPFSKPPDAVELPSLPMSPPLGYMSMYSSG
ncbi:uncharacterized protein F4817DRAFT_362837 [Daldinia loculata]|uniref:uncharacterized protein n=1 Tax=Daldinia loculata TaxID=103429 RepID=UPI0020C24BB8|nr:uncharacterized protein F4817DRAFT_362837 [Daldinia loculata]KAI1641742.1 hypothetical protein F4817DRAFT_362837 [Daldinia loculata]